MTPSTMPNSTAMTPTKSEIRRPKRIVEKTSRPWSSVPRTKRSPVKAFSVPGGVKPFMRFSVAGSNGSCGATQGAKSAASTSARTTAADTIATGERRNP